MASMTRTTTKNLPYMTPNPVKGALHILFKGPPYNSLPSSNVSHIAGGAALPAAETACSKGDPATKALGTSGKRTWKASLYEPCMYIHIHIDIYIFTNIYIHTYSYILFLHPPYLHSDNVPEKT